MVNSTKKEISEVKSYRVKSEKEKQKFERVMLRATNVIRGEERRKGGR